VATSGEIQWPPTGSFPWPPSHLLAVVSDAYFRVSRIPQSGPSLLYVVDTHIELAARHRARHMGKGPVDASSRSANRTIAMREKHSSAGRHRARLPGRQRTRSLVPGEGAIGIVRGTRRSSRKSPLTRSAGVAPTRRLPLIRRARALSAGRTSFSVGGPFASGECRSDEYAANHKRDENDHDQRCLGGRHDPVHAHLLRIENDERQDEACGNRGKPEPRDLGRGPLTARCGQWTLPGWRTIRH